MKRKRRNLSPRRVPGRRRCRSADLRSGFLAFRGASDSANFFGNFLHHFDGRFTHFA